jgi:hypothetical protein
MKKNSRANRGQFSIIAALLVAIILVAAVIMTYAAVRNNPFQQPPKVLSSIGEMNLSIKRILEFATGYYGSILQVTGNSTYAKELTSNYLYSGFINIARSHPEWNPSFDINSSGFSTLWFAPTSYTMGNVSVTYSLSGLGVEGVKYETSSLLKVDILETLNNQARVLITREENKPDLTLGTGNFFFYNYSYSDSAWKPISPSDLQVFSNGTYVLQIPDGVDPAAYSIQVIDPRNIMAIAFFSEVSLVSGLPQYTYKLTWNSSLYSSLNEDTIIVEALQNGTLRWLGQELELSPRGRPIPPIPVKSFRVNQTIDGVSQEVPFQVEDWGSNYRVPLGLSSEYSVFSSRNMIVFLVNHRVEEVTLWWDGRDTANQTTYATTNRYFTNDDPGNHFLTNGILDLNIDASGSNFIVTSTVGSSTSTAEFMRINGESSRYGADPAYVIHHGIVRDIIQQEAEWFGNGAPDCPNVYSQIVLTLPANATYYTYALRTIFVSSLQSRTITDLSAIQLSVGGGQALTENGTSGGMPVVSSATGLFYNFSSFETGWAHHWSEFIEGSQGGGIMFTNSSNFKLYTFDSIAGEKTGALNVIASSQTIEFNPVALSEASFTYPLDITWHGAVVTFQDEPIYPGLWVMVEHPPTIEIS